MSDTIVDMPKVTQMLDAGWKVRLWKGGMGSYEIRAFHDSDKRMAEMRLALCKTMQNSSVFATIYGNTNVAKAVEDFHFDDDGWLMTDEFTPQQALTRIAYKVHGEII